MNTEFENGNLPETNVPVEEPVTPVPQSPAETVGFWTFFGLMALFAIPVVGLIAAIVFLFAPKKKTLKNYAGAVLTWTVLRLIAAATTVLLVLTLFGGMILPALNQQLGTDLNNIFEVIGLVSDLESGNYSKVIAQFRGPLLEMMGEEYAPLLDELASGNYDKLFHQIEEEEYDALLRDLENGEYKTLTDKLNPEDYKALTDELRSAAKGEHSELFDGLKEYMNSVNFLK